MQERKVKKIERDNEQKKEWDRSKKKSNIKEDRETERNKKERQL